jgi:hypothetical protein
MRTVPRVGGMTPVQHRNVVVLPAPLGHGRELAVTFGEAADFDHAARQWGIPRAK